MGNFSSMNMSCGLRGSLFRFDEMNQQDTKSMGKNYSFFPTDARYRAGFDSFLDQIFRSPFRFNHHCFSLLIVEFKNLGADPLADRKSTRLNSSHSQISYA